MAANVGDILKIVLALFLPPLGVFLERGLNEDFLINFLLTLLGYIPGVVHALILLIRVPVLHPMHDRAPEYSHATKAQRHH